MLLALEPAVVVVVAVAVAAVAVAVVAVVVVVVVVVVVLSLSLTLSLSLSLCLHPSLSPSPSLSVCLSLCLSFAGTSKNTVAVPEKHRFAQKTPFGCRKNTLDAGKIPFWSCENTIAEVMKKHRGCGENTLMLKKYHLGAEKTLINWC